MPRPATNEAPEIHATYWTWEVQPNCTRGVSTVFERWCVGVTSALGGTRLLLPF